MVYPLLTYPLIAHQNHNLVDHDNALGHFGKVFEHNGVQVCFFPPNCTSWKQPNDQGIIAALKKRYKYLNLKEVLNFTDLDEDDARQLHEFG